MFKFLVALIIIFTFAAAFLWVVRQAALRFEEKDVLRQIREASPHRFFRKSDDDRFWVVCICGWQSAYRSRDDEVLYRWYHDHVRSTFVK